MAKALSVDLRRRVVEAVAAGASWRAAAAHFEVGGSSATPSASARWMDEMPLSDCRINHSPMSQVRNGSFVPCDVVRVVTVNWKRQSGLQH